MPAHLHQQHRSKHQARLAEAQSLFQSRNYPDAAVQCERILAKLPGDFDALYLLGAIRHAQGRLPEALDALARALKTNARSAEVLFNHAMILANLNRHEEALVSYGRAASLKPDWAEAQHGRGRALLDAGRPEEAVPCLETALRLKPDFVDALNSLGNALIALGRPEEALPPLGRALRLRPDHVHALYNLGTALTRLGRLPEALSSYQRAIAAAPRYAQAHANCGVIWLKLANHGEALASCDRAIALDPGCANAWFTRGNVLHDLTRYDEAVASYDRALALDPANVDGMIRCGTALAKSGRLAEALAQFDRASMRDDKSALAWARRGDTLHLLGRLPEAIESHDRALALDPDDAILLAGKGYALLHARRPHEAIACADRALAIEPGFAKARLDKALANLVLGNLADGWPDYEYRFQAPGGPRHPFDQPRWTGSEPIEGKTLLVHDEQGLGDVIQFVRYVPLVAERARVLLGLRPSLVRLLSGLGGVQIVTPRDHLPGFDFHCPLLSLPLAFKTTLETVPGAVPYLAAEPALVDGWRQRLASLPGLKVGLVWAGNPGPTVDLRAIDRRRSLALAQMYPLAGIPGVSFVSLQKGDAGAQTRSAPADFVIRDWTDELNDLADTAALIGALDLVISVDTSIVHLAGALARPVWMLNRYESEWRWLLDREDSPWYPTLRQFRQPQPGDWTSVIARIADALAKHASPPR